MLCDADLPDAGERQRLASAADQKATVFVAPDRRRVAMHNRKLERPLIGHALIGAVHVLSRGGVQVDVFDVPAGPVTVGSATAEHHWLRAPAAWAPDQHSRQVRSASEVERITEAPADEPVLVWAWINEARGWVRARFFGPSVGKPEDEACGTACMVLSERLGRELDVLHGMHGSSIAVKPCGDVVQCTGRCVIDEGAAR